MRRQPFSPVKKVETLSPQSRYFNSCQLHVLVDYYFILCLQSLLKKHEAFESDLEVHRARVGETEEEGQGLINDVSLMYLLLISVFKVDLVSYSG